MLYYGQNAAGVYGFHDDDLEPVQAGWIAEDAWGISHADLFAGVATGQVIVPTKKGLPSLAAPAGPTPDQVTKANQALARMALSDSDVVVLRAYEAGVPVTDDWKAYRAALRPIASTGALPAEGMPAKPEPPAS